jgi:hypothetical protein
VYVPSSSGSTGEGRRLQDPGQGFGLHCVNVSAHLTTGGLSTAEVEDKFTTNLGDMKTFNAFMDFSVSLYTTAIAQYASAFDADSVPYYTTAWSDENGQSYTSLIVRVAKTQMLIELTSKKSLSASETKRDVHIAHSSERRMSARSIAMIEKLEQSNSLSAKSLTPVSVNRGVSSAVLAKLDDFYVTGMGTKKQSEDSSENGDYTRKCYLWSGAEVENCFTNRADSTNGAYTVADFENMLNTVHKNIIGGYPLCGTDKWEDNHYAIDSMDASTSGIISYINKGNTYYICDSEGRRAGRSLQSGGGASLHYIFDPTGWGIQADLSFNTQPSGCSSQNLRRRLQGGNPACSAGTCAKSVVV